MKLENIGFYTLSDERARTASATSRMMRAEIILTNRCNFHCPYCRGTKPVEASFHEVAGLIRSFANDGLYAIRFSGGEPTLWPHLKNAVKIAKESGIEKIAVSSNGSADPRVYRMLMAAGVNDFSISLDACCSATGDVMAGQRGQWSTVTDNIRKIVQAGCYVTVGIVLTERNIGEAVGTIALANDLGVSDIRVIPAAQNPNLLMNTDGVQGQLARTPILQYRIDRMNAGQMIRGIDETDNRSCPLVLDDVAVMNGKHYPCIIYLREGGEPIGDVNSNMRQERAEWFKSHNTYKDRICRGNCLDVCVAYNNRWQDYACGRADLPQMDSSLFDWLSWRGGSDILAELGIPCRYDELTATGAIVTLHRAAVGWCDGASVLCRPKASSVAVMYQHGERRGWMHMRKNEFWRVFAHD